MHIYHRKTKASATYQRYKLPRNAKMLSDFYRDTFYAGTQVLNCHKKKSAKDVHPSA
jgi:hypothetical protein